MPDERPVVEVAPYQRGCLTVWRVTLPKSPVLSGRAEVGSREGALRLAGLIADEFGWTVHDRTGEEPPA
ncbi:hypothetical protein [Sphaerimonospora mesophila]|uniref:hypothetical protein n=1 Tax=Sphaerimonospora mesophila TaxID=37483 RepID=UPI0006E222BC